MKLLPDQVDQLNSLLNKLVAVSADTFSKANYQITYQENGSLRTITIFKKESFVYKGNYLESWTERMIGSGSKGYRLSSKLLDELHKYVK